MLELIALVCGLILCVYLPIEAGKVRRGWVRKSFKGTPEEFRAAYVKQVNYFMWIGVGIGTIDLALAPLNAEGGEWVFNVISAVLWLTVAGIGFYTKGQFAQKPA
jgi:hypothetical protein